MQVRRILPCVLALLLAALPFSVGALQKKPRNASAHAATLAKQPNKQHRSSASGQHVVRAKPAATHAAKTPGVRAAQRKHGAKGAAVAAKKSTPPHRTGATANSVRKTGGKAHVRHGSQPVGKPHAQRPLKVRTAKR